MVITKILPREKGRVQISFDSADDLILYKSEARQLELEEQMTVTDALYDQIYRQIIGKRVVKRAMHLLEKMDRTEEQLRRKLVQGEYPQELIEDAVAYVKSYRYIDDDRYARTFIRLNQERKSSGRMKMDLLSRGIAQDIIEQALEEENETDQKELIRRLLEKKQYHPDRAAPQEKMKMYRFLAGRGFRCDEIMQVLNETGSLDMPL